MDEYIKRESAIREIEQITPVDYGAMWDYEAHHWAGECLRDCKEAIDSIPAADVAPVVRCKDCVHCGYCGKETNLEVMGFYGFCSRGERKEER